MDDNNKKTNVESTSAQVNDEWCSLEEALAEITELSSFGRGTEINNDIVFESDSEENSEEEHTLPIDKPKISNAKDMIEKQIIIHKEMELANIPAEVDFNAMIRMKSGSSVQHCGGRSESCTDEMPSNNSKKVNEFLDHYIARTENAKDLSDY